MSKFELESSFLPKGDQGQAIDKLSVGIEEGRKAQVLLGITGSGKTFTMANVIAKAQKPTLILAHNKTLAAQLYQEFKAFFPNNHVEYFVSYYDYFQPEVYIVRSDTYIEKDFAINDTIDRMRLSATRSLLEYDDVIIVSSVSCIYGLGSPEYVREMATTLYVGQKIERNDLLKTFVDMHYERNDIERKRATFRARGDVIEIVPAYEDKKALRVEMFGDEIEAISEIDPLTGQKFCSVNRITLYPGSHFVTPGPIRKNAIRSIKAELKNRQAVLESEGKLIEEKRITERTLYDLEMIRQVGFCKGIENYSLHFSQRLPGQPPACLLDYFPSDFLLFVDESHQTVPQVRAMVRGDRSRKEPLVQYGFRLPSAFDNRPLSFDEFLSRLHQVIYVSATPGEWEINETSGRIVQQIIRPTGLLDPICEVRPATNQVDDCIAEIQKEIASGGRVLVTILTKKLSEDLTSFLQEANIKAKYLHSEIDTLERVQIIKDLRVGLFDVLVGINLLREGLDIPEVTLVAILDADKTGFLRSETALIQTCGRAARNARGRVILYADTKTEAIRSTLEITKNRRAIQEEHNKKYNITPATVQGNRPKTLIETFFGEEQGQNLSQVGTLTKEEIQEKIANLEHKMTQAAKAYEFRDAAAYRDEIEALKKIELL